MLMTPAQPDGFLATPAGGEGSPVLVLHPWWGLNDTIKAFCTRLAEAGFLVFAPDLYHGKITDQITEADTLSSALGEKFEKARAEIIEAKAFLKARTGADDSGIAVIGFSMGAFYALDLASSAADDIRAVVVFYGTGPSDYSQSKAEFLGHFAENDPYEPQEAVDALEDALKQAGRSVTFYRYGGTEHWFFEPDRSDAYDEAAANLAWERTLAFLSHSAAS